MDVLETFDSRESRKISAKVPRGSIMTAYKLIPGEVRKMTREIARGNFPRVREDGIFARRLIIETNSSGTER